MQRVFSYFPTLTEQQKKQFLSLPELYNEWNAKINVISRKDMEQFVVHHVLHSLAIAKVQPFNPEALILDIGTGGGFPGIPLAILFPDTHFHLVDSIGKKIRVVQAVSDAIGLKNVTAFQERAENLKERYDYVVNRAVSNMSNLCALLHGRCKKTNHHALPNGLLCLKGGNLDEELRPYHKIVSLYKISDIFDDPFFETKLVVHLPM